MASGYDDCYDASWHLFPPDYVEEEYRILESIKMPRTSFHIHDILQLDSKPSQEETEVQGSTTVLPTTNDVPSAYQQFFEHTTAMLQPAIYANLNRGTLPPPPPGLLGWPTGPTLPTTLPQPLEEVNAVPEGLKPRDSETTAQTAFWWSIDQGESRGKNRAKDAIVETTITNRSTLQEDGRASSNGSRKAEAECRVCWNVARVCASLEMISLLRIEKVALGTGLVD